MPRSTQDGGCVFQFRRCCYAREEIFRLADRMSERRSTRWYRQKNRDRDFQRRDSDSEDNASSDDHEEERPRKRRNNGALNRLEPEEGHARSPEAPISPNSPNPSLAGSDESAATEESHRDEDLEPHQEHGLEVNENQILHDDVNAQNDPVPPPVPVDPHYEHSSGESDASNSDDSNSESSESDSEQSDEDNNDSGSGEDDDPEEELHRTPIFNGAQITYVQSLLAILTFILTHKLTGLCVSDLLRLISLHCGPDNICVKTLNRFKKFFKMIGKEVVVCHYFCASCEIPVAGKDANCRRCHQNNTAYFIEIPIVTQLQTMFIRPGFFESLQFRFTRVKKNQDNIEDIYDGCIYQQLFRNGFLSNPNNISYFMYFDGIALFKSSKFSIWPIYLTINELKYKLRTKRENTVLAGLWFGKTKPNPNLFLLPFHEKLSMLENVGADVTLPNGDIINVKSKLLGAVGDLPAKALFMCMRQFNGAFSCPHCMEQGGRFGLDKTSIQVFPYRRDFQLRSDEEVDQYAEQALFARRNDPDASVYGIKGPSLLSSMLPSFVLCMGIDIMHGVFLGAMKTLANLWFDTKYSNFPFSVCGLVHIVDQRLKSIKPPFSFQRLPRSFKLEIALMKAADWKIFMLYYSLPVLLGILPEAYWLHHLKLVTAVSVICQESISLDNLNNADELFHAYVADFENLYGIRYLGLTFHQLLHICLVVRNLGPAWVYSCFFYESLNGELSRLVHGSRHAALQISSSCSAFMNLPIMIRGMPEGSAKELCLRLQQTWASRIKIVEYMDHETAIVGTLSNCQLSEVSRQLLRDTFNIVGGHCKRFFRMKKKGTLYSSSQYKRCKRKVSCYVEIVSENIPYLCKITEFVKWSSCVSNCLCNECRHLYVCIVDVFDRVPWEMHDNMLPIFPSHLYKVSPAAAVNARQAFPISCIKSECIYIPVGNCEYICIPVNSLEVE